jgi:NADH-quinone oxidoreductase subunit A
METVQETAFFPPWEPSVFALGLFAFMSLILVAVLLFVSHWLGQKKPNPEKSRPYECGVIPTGTVRSPYPVPFYLIAAFFLIFDVEAAYIFSWAIAFDRLGWSGWLKICFFIFILIVTLLYLWIKGGLDWGPTARKEPVTPETSS